MNHFFKAFLAIFIGLSSITAQELEKTWESTAPESIYKTLKFSNGEFNFSSNAIGDLKGDYMYQNNLLVLYHNDSLNSIKRYKITELTDSTLVFSGKELRFNLVSKEEVEIVAEPEVVGAKIIPNQGFSFTSLWRGILGMVTLIFVAFLFSSNRKAINWKTVGIGLLFQLIIAVGVLKVDFVKTVFEVIGQGFIAILGFTQAGSEFLFGGMLDINSFGFIFAFQVLPTIIFFSALTSVLFYLGLIQKVVKGMGWLLSKVLRNFWSRKFKCCR